MLMLGMFLVVKYIESLDTGSTPLELPSHLYRVGKLSIIVKDQREERTFMGLPSLSMTTVNTHINASSRNSEKS